MPSDLNSWSVFGDQDLLESVRRQPGKPGSLLPDRAKETWYFVRLLQAAAVEVVAPAKGRDAPFTKEPLKLELLEWQVAMRSTSCRSSSNEIRSGWYLKPAGNTGGGRSNSSEGDACIIGR